MDLIIIQVFINGGRIIMRSGIIVIGIICCHNSLGFSIGQDSFSSTTRPYRHQRVSVSST